MAHPGIPGVTFFLSRRLADALTGGGDAGGEDGGLFWSEYKPIGSTAIFLVKHRLRDGNMTVRFKKTGLYPDYLFPDVPRGVFRDWKRSMSPGRYYHANVKNQYGM